MQLIITVGLILKANENVNAQNVSLKVLHNI